MAQRTLQRLVSQGYVLRRTLRSGGCLYVLSQTGAYWLRDQGIPANVRGGRDLRWSHPYHRVLGNEIAIDLLRQKDTVWTEYEIKRGLAPLTNIDGFVPDLLSACDLEYPDAMIWFEVENSAKSRTRMARLMGLAHRLVNPTDGYPIGKYHMERFVFVTPNKQSFNAVRRAMHRFSQTVGFGTAALDRISALRCDLTPSLHWQGVGEYLSVEKILDGMDPAQREKRGEPDEG
jgi:hypothetical protein